MSTILQNTIILKELLTRYRDENELISYEMSQVFEVFAVQQITRASSLSFLEIEDAIVDSTSDGGIDCFLILVDDKTVSSLDELEDLEFTKDTKVRTFISQAKMSESFSEKILDKFNITAPIIFDLDTTEQELWQRFNDKLVEKILLLRKAWSMAVQKHIILEVDLSYICTANQVQINQAFRAKANQICRAIEEKAVKAAKVKFSFFSAKELIELYQKPQSTSLQLKFKENPTPIEYRPGEYGYVGVVYLRDFFKFVVDADGTIREFIMEENVRHYQGEVDVNRGIRKTLQEDFEVDFWWLNNGVTVIASRCTPYPRQLHLDDVQIVNGLQTSYTVGRYYDRNQQPDERSILVKVLIVKSEDKETIDKIISSTNRQNPVTPTVLRATENVQRKLELFFFNRGYYYDRRKNYYRNQNKPARRIFSIQYAAQAIEAILNFSPSTARAQPTSLIKSQKTYERIFDENRNFEAYLNCCLLYQKVMDYVKTGIPREEKSEIRNYSYHLARITASLLTGKPRYTADEFRGINSSEIDDGVIKESHSFLRSILVDYQIAYPDDTIPNYISKSSRFSTAINERLETELKLRG